MGFTSIILSFVKGVSRFPFGLMYLLKERPSGTTISTSSGKGLCSLSCHNSSGFSFRISGILLKSVKTLKPIERKIAIDQNELLHSFCKLRDY